MSLTKKIVALLSAFILLCSCDMDKEKTQKPDNEIQDSLNQQMTATPVTVGYISGRLNPITDNLTVNSSVYSLMYEGLFELDADFNAHPVLCKEIYYDQFNYTVIIKDGIYFHSGKKLTAYDVAYSLNLAKNTEDSPYRSRLNIVSDIKAVSDVQVNIKLSRLHSSLEVLLDVPIIASDSSDMAFPSGTGPYMCQSGRLNVYDSWHGDYKPSIKVINLSHLPSSEAYLSSFEIGGISIVGARGLSESTQAFKGDVTVYKIPSASLHFLGFNHRNYPYNLPKVRKAFSLLLDRNSLCKNSMQDCVFPANLPFYPQPSYISLEQDKKQALDLLKECGIWDMNSDGILEITLEDGTHQAFSPTIIVNAENRYKIDLLQQYVQELKECGINANINKIAFEGYNDDLTRGNFDIYYAQIVLNSDFEVAPLISSSGYLNYGNYKDADTDRAIYSVQSATKNTLETKLKEFFKNFSQKFPIVPIGFEKNLVVIRPNASQNITPYPFNITKGIGS